jgi:hypothetical protein
MLYLLQYLFSRLKLLPIPRCCDHPGVHPTGSTSHKSCSWGIVVLKSCVKYLYGCIPPSLCFWALHPWARNCHTEPGPSLYFPAYLGVICFSDFSQKILHNARVLSQHPQETLLPASACSNRCGLGHPPSHPAPWAPQHHPIPHDTL